VLIAGRIDDADLALAGDLRNRKKSFCLVTLFNFLQRGLSAFRTNLQINVELTRLTPCQSSDVIGVSPGNSWINMNREICFALLQRIYRIRYPSGERLTLTLCSV